VLAVDPGGTSFPAGGRSRDAWSLIDQIGRIGVAKGREHRAGCRP